MKARLFFSIPFGILRSFSPRDCAAECEQVLWCWDHLHAGRLRHPPGGLTPNPRQWLVLARWEAKQKSETLIPPLCTVPFFWARSSCPSSLSAGPWPEPLTWLKESVEVFLRRFVVAWGTGSLCWLSEGHIVIGIWKARFRTHVLDRSCGGCQTKIVDLFPFHELQLWPCASSRLLLELSFFLCRLLQVRIEGVFRQS